mgnify:FL=1
MGRLGVSKDRKILSEEELNAYRQILLFEIQCREGMSVNSFCDQLSEIKIEEADIIEKKNQKEIISDSKVSYSSKTAKRCFDDQEKAKRDYEWFFRAGTKALEIDEVVMYNMIDDYLELEEQEPVTLDLYREKIRPSIGEYKALYESAREQAFANTKLGKNILLLSRLIREQYTYIPQLVALYNVFYNFTPEMQSFFNAYMEMWEINSADSNDGKPDTIGLAEINDKIDSMTEYEASKPDYKYLFILKEMLNLPLKELEDYYKLLCTHGYFERRITISDFRNKKINANWLGCILDYYSLLTPREQSEFFYVAVKFTFVKDKQSVIQFIKAY